MAEDSNNGAAGAETAAQFNVQKIYVKDVSFEAPNAPQIFNEQAQPQLQLNLAQKVGKLGNDVFEVMLTLTLTCSVADKTAYLVEITQAGVFGLTGFDERTLDGMLGTYCPNVLFPYARQNVSDLIQNGGFPPFYLQPINFDALYAEGLRRRQQQSLESAQQPPTGNA